MSVHVEITVRDGRGRWTVTATADERSGDNPRYAATQTERAIVEAGRQAVAAIVGMHGDIRDTVLNLSERDAARPITGAAR